jgi:hypothetical protein
MSSYYYYLDKQIENNPNHLSSEEVAVRAGRKVLMVADLYFTDHW